MSSMARLRFGRLSDAWKGEAADFTPLLAEQLDAIGAEIGVDLASVGESEVQTAGGRRIDIVAQGEDGSEFVIENQYGRADHDHLTRGLAYAVARRARGLIVVAEEHRDEFRAVASYLNDLAELDPERGIAIWLVEARAVRIEDSLWAPLFSAVVEPNVFTATVEQSEAVCLGSRIARGVLGAVRCAGIAGGGSAGRNPVDGHGASASPRSEPRRARGGRSVDERLPDRRRRLLRWSHPRSFQLVRRPEQRYPDRTSDDAVVPLGR